MKTLVDILIIEPNTKDAQLIEESLADQGLCAVMHKFSSINQKAMEACEVTDFDIVLVEIGQQVGEDFNLSKDVFDALAKLCEKCAKVIVCSSSADMQHVHQSFMAGATTFFYKPVMYSDYRKIALLIGEQLSEVTHMYGPAPKAVAKTPAPVVTPKRGPRNRPALKKKMKGAN